MPITLAQLFDHPSLHAMNTDDLQHALAPIWQVAFDGFCLDSRQLSSQSPQYDNKHDDSKHDSKPAFVLLASTTQDMARSAEYAKQALPNTAFILSEIDPVLLVKHCPQLSNYPHIVHTPDIRQFLGSMMAVFLSTKHSTKNQASTPLPTVVAVTGTNGKTTITHLVAQLMQSMGNTSAVMGTAGNGKLGSLTQATHTTGDALAVQQFFYQMAQDGVSILAIEASSHGLDQYRLQGLPIKVAIYSNLSRDHMDYHANMDEYAIAKARLFDRYHFPSLTHAIINADDTYANLMINTAKHGGLTVWTYSLVKDKSIGKETDAHFVATDIQPSLTGTQIHLNSPFGQLTVNSPLLGRFNVANLLAAMATSVALGVSLDDLPTQVSQLKGADGRMEQVSVPMASPMGCFIVDYAHTPDALTQVLSSLKPHCMGKLWAVFGCGGNRDKGKRPLMAQAGLAVADKVVLTSDNPRYEDPNQILNDMQTGMTCEQHYKTIIEADRRQAIEYAVRHAKKNDIVVIAGKGHETYQEIQGVRHDFDDRQVVSELLKVHHQ